ncbi:MAG: general stress protein [Anaerolineae bacterium]|nr:general stress protein [Anaerolineae bacterium]
MKRIAGLFEHEQAADRAISELQKKGFNKEHFGVITRNRITQKVNREEDIREGTVKADQKLGVTGGAAVGGLTGLLLGVGALFIPGIGPVLAAGTLGAIAAGTGMGAVAGGLLGALTSMGITEEAEVYAEGIKRGGVLLVVEADDERAPEVDKIMTQAGAVEVKARRQAWQEAGWSGFDETKLPEEDYSRFSW